MTEEIYDYINSEQYQKDLQEPIIIDTVEKFVEQMSKNYDFDDYEGAIIKPKMPFMIRATKPDGKKDE